MDRSRKRAPAGTDTLSDDERAATYPKEPTQLEETEQEKHGLCTKAPSFWNERESF
jgi:hypothetical protein